MKNTIFSLLVVFATSLCLSACVKNQNANTDPNAVVSDQSMNNTNYQNMMDEQTQRAQEEADEARAADVDADHPHVGGRR